MTCRTASPQAKRPAERANAPPKCWRLFSIRQAADFAGVPVQQIIRWVKIGKLEAYHLHGGQVRIDELELADCISSPASTWR